MAKSSPVCSPHCTLAMAALTFKVITQCSMRHLYACSSEPGVSYLIDKAKTYERRRCGHLPADYPEPLTSQECITSVVDPKGSKHNKHRYVIASQDLETRKAMRAILGVPLVYINRSVMIMEPMAGATVENREREERGKFRVGLKRGSGSLKRKREDDGDEEGEEAKEKKKKVAQGPKGPNPLAVKKSKKQAGGEGEASTSKSEKDSAANAEGEQPEAGAKRKRKRKHKSAPETGGGGVEVSGVAEEDE